MSAESETLDLDRFGTQRDVAAALGIDQSAVSRWVGKGVIKPRKSDGKIHIGTAVAAVEAARDPDAAIKGIAGGDAVSLETQSKRLSAPNQLLKARTVAATLAVQKQNIELQKLKGDLVAKADVMAAIRSAQTVVVERLEGLPGLLAARVIAASSVAAGEQIIRDAVRGLREELLRLGDAIDGT